MTAQVGTIMRAGSRRINKTQTRTTAMMMNASIVSLNPLPVSAAA
jgi:hypothetical protein